MTVLFIFCQSVRMAVRPWVYIICIMRGVAETHRLRSYRGIVSSVNGRELLALGGLILSTWVTVGATSVAFTSR